VGKAPAFPLYASDFDMDTATWENDEVGAYLRLLLYEWVNGGLPEDTYRLSKIVRESEKKFIGKWKNLSTKFHLNGNGLLVNEKLEFVRQEKAQFIESQREKGKRSAKKRWGDRVTPVIMAVTERLQPESNPSSSSSSSSSSKKKHLTKQVLSDEEWIAKIKEINPWLDWDDLNREMDTWLVNHPERNKTRAFISNWILRKQKDKPMGMKKKRVW
jgi:uncharacterized protein YdaU (DUF1376 family)